MTGLGWTQTYAQSVVLQVSAGLTFGLSEMSHAYHDMLARVAGLVSHLSFKASDNILRDLCFAFRRCGMLWTRGLLSGIS